VQQNFRRDKLLAVMFCGDFSYRLQHIRLSLTGQTKDVSGKIGYEIG